MGSRSRRLLGRVGVGLGTLCFAALAYLTVVLLLGSVLGLPTDRPSTALGVAATSVVVLRCPGFGAGCDVSSSAAARVTASFGSRASCRVRCPPVMFCHGLRGRWPS